MRWKSSSSVLIGALLVVGCAPSDALDQDEPDRTPSPSTDESSEPAAKETADSTESQGPDQDEDEDPAETQEDAGPAEMLEDDGYWRPSDLPEAVAETVIEAPLRDKPGETGSARIEVLGVDINDDAARLTFAWLPPVEGNLLSDRLLVPGRVATTRDPFVRLIDRDASEVLVPLQTADDEDPGSIEEGPRPHSQSGTAVRTHCLCTPTQWPDEEPVDDPEDVMLYAIDFPAPESDTVEIFLGEYHEPITEVLVTEDEAFDIDASELADYMTTVTGEGPSDEYGEGAGYATRYPINARYESLTGLTMVRDGETQEVSLPADVLFEFGEYDLIGDAESIIEDAAQKLNQEAAGQTVIIEGHTDNVSGHDINQPLSENRAEAVADAIQPLLDDDITIETEGHSFNRPQVPNVDPDGAEIPENQALNRRVSFRYTVVEDSGEVIDLGFEELEDLPEAEETDTADDALASYILTVPSDISELEEVRLDILGVEEVDGVSTLQVAYASTDGEFHESAFFNVGDGPHVFGYNSHHGSRGVPSMAQSTIVDLEAELQHFPLSMGGDGCLCTEVPATVWDLSGESTQMFAQYQLPEDLSDDLVLRIPDSAQIQLPEEVTEQLSSSD